MRKDRVALKYDAPVQTRFARGLCPVDADLAPRRTLLSQQKPQEGGLATPGRSDDGDELSLVHVHSHAFDDRAVVIGLEQVADGDKTHSPSSAHG